MKKSRIDTNFLERYTIDKHNAKKGVQFENDKNSVIEINCMPNSQAGLIEHIIEEVDIDDYLPSTSVIEEGSQVIEVPDIADRDGTSFRSVDITSKWTPSDTFTFLEAIKAVLTEEEISGGYLSRKSLFEKVAELLKENGSNVSSTDVEKKYNNMLITYRRCQKRLIQKKQAPLWPYFKMVVEIQTKFEELESSLSDKHIRRLLELENNKLRVKNQKHLNGHIQSYPYVSTFFGGNKTLVPNCLTKKWQLKRMEQENEKIALMQRVLADRKARRKSYSEIQSKFQMSMNSENKILSLF